MKSPLVLKFQPTAQSSFPRKPESSGAVTFWIPALRSAAAGMTKKVRAWIAVAFVLLFSFGGNVARAELQININSGNVNPLPIAISALDAEDPVREPSIMILPAKLVCILALLKPVSHTAEGNIAGGVNRWM